MVAVTINFSRPMAGFRTVLGLSSKVKRWPTYEELYSGAWMHPNPRNGKSE